MNDTKEKVQVYKITRQGGKKEGREGKLQVQEEIKIKKINKTETEISTILIFATHTRYLSVGM